MKKRIVSAAAVVWCAAVVVLSAAGPCWGMYHPQAGRWLQRDPAGYVDGVNASCYGLANPTCWTDPSGEKVYFAIYYVNPEKDKPRSFERAAKTWERGLKASPAWNEKCDVVIMKGVKTAPEFKAAWTAIEKEVGERLKNPKKYTVPDPNDTKKTVECTCDEHILEGRIFSHASNTGNAGLEFVAGDKEDGTIDHKEIGQLEVLQWKPQEALLVLHSCNTGNKTDKRGKAVAEVFMDRQQVKVMGQTGTAYFSTTDATYVTIEGKDAADQDVYLWAYNRGQNNWLGDGKKMPGITFTPAAKP